LYLKKDLQKQLRPQIVTWGQRSWRGSVRMFEDYGTRDLPAVLALGDAIVFQAKVGIANTAAMRKKLWERVRARVQADDRLVWRSPNSWELNGSLLAIEVRGKQSAILGARLWREHKIVVRAFPAKGLNTLRLSLNTMNTAAEIDAFFVAVTGLR
jgi:selenocysteine lyase/cysteine desulfurase